MHKTSNVMIRVEELSGEQFLIRGLGVALALCILAYLYFVGLSIMNVIANREASVESTRLQSTVSSLEEEYFTLSRAISPEAGANLGLTQSEETFFVRRVNNMASNVLPAGI